MKQLNGLTEMEKMVMKALINGMYAEAGFSDQDINDIKKETNIENKVLRGVIGSLTKKGIIDVYPNDEYMILEIRENYWGLVPIWVDQEGLEPIQII